MAWKSALLLAFVSLAGCADAAEPAALLEDEAPPGVLRGVVVDPAIRPLADADVLVMPGAHSNRTDATGTFQFDDLEPGTYTITVSLQGYLNETVVAGVTEGSNPVVKVILPVDTEAVAYVTEYLFQGMFECGVFPVACSYVNIITWVMLCGVGACVGNVTNDSALFLQWIDGVPSFLQTELVWDSTQPLGDNLGFGIGSSTEEQLQQGQADTHNYSVGPSPIMLTLQDPDLAASGIGADRALLTQVLSAPSREIPGGCVWWNPCGPGVQVLQDFETFTHTFYGFEPEPGWRFSEHGSPQPP